MFVADDYQNVRELADAPRTILDLGANIGLSVRLWQEWFPNAEIVAVEPNPQSVAIARQNISIGPKPDAVKFIEAAIGHVAGTVYLSTADQPWLHSTVSVASESTIAVSSVTVSDCLEMLGSCDRFDLCKCDIEGAEAGLFRHCREWIEKIGVLLIETHAPYNIEILETDLKKNGSSLRLNDRTQRGGHSIAYFDRELR